MAPTLEHPNLYVKPQLEIPMPRFQGGSEHGELPLGHLEVHDQIDERCETSDEHKEKVLQAYYETKIKACSHTGDIHGAEALLREMRERDIPVTINTCNSVVHACTRANELGLAEMYVSKMENESNVGTNEMTYNSVIDACASKGDSALAEAWYERMIKRGVQPNTVTYGTICKVFARQGAVRKVESLMEFVEASGIKLNVYFYASLISACGAAHPPDFARAERAVEDLVQRGLRPQSVRRVLARVVGRRRAAQVLQHYGCAVDDDDDVDQGGPQYSTSKYWPPVRQQDRAQVAAVPHPTSMRGMAHERRRMPPSKLPPPRFQLDKQFSEQTPSILELPGPVGPVGEPLYHSEMGIGGGALLPGRYTKVVHFNF